jgi:hypothetical protein
MLVVEMRIPLPEGLFESSDVISKVREATNHFESALIETFGNGFELTVNTVTKRQPRAEGAAKPGRKPKAEANGQAAVATA